MRCGAVGFVAMLAGLLTAAPGATAAMQVTEFQLTPASLKAGSHPNIAFTAAFTGADNTTGVSDISLHLPVGLRAKPTAAPFCTKTRLIENRCPVFSQVGTVAVTGSAFGTTATINRQIYNMKPSGNQKVRLGAIALPGIPVSIPLTGRPDGGLDLSITGIPKIGGPITVQLDRIELHFKGKVRKKAVLTIPSSCTPATTVLDIGFYDLAVPRVTATSSFTPTGC